MSPDAPEAEIFKEYARKHESQNGTATIPAAATGTLIIKKLLLLSFFFNYFPFYPRQSYSFRDLLEPHVSLVQKPHEN